MIITSEVPLEQLAGFVAVMMFLWLATFAAIGITKAIKDYWEYGPKMDTNFIWLVWATLACVNVVGPVILLRENPAVALLVWFVISASATVCVTLPVYLATRFWIRRKQLVMSAE